jgi:hypothetical protein
MRSLILLALVALAALPLAAREHGRGSRRVVVERSRCAPYPRWEARDHDDRGWGDRRWEGRRWDERWENRRWASRYDCEDDRLILGPLPLPRPLLPPFRGQVMIRIH